MIVITCVTKLGSDTHTAAQTATVEETMESTSRMLL